MRVRHLTLCVTVAVLLSLAACGGKSRLDAVVNTTGGNYGDSPLDLWVTCRVAYNHSGDKKLYGFVRKLSFDAGGRLVVASAETRVEIDAAEVC